MKPYYSDDLVTLYHGDCLEVTAWLKADVLVTDPPYGKAWAQHGTAERRGWRSDRHLGILNDAHTEVRDHALALWSAESRPAIVFGDVLVAAPHGAAHALIYDKGVGAGFAGAIGGYRRDVEAIYLLGPHGTGLGGRSAILRTNGRTGGNLARTTGHPHTKPVDLMGQLISCAPLGTVADPFAGSGTTLVAAKLLGRRAIGVELDERYCEVAANRLAQDTLFGGAA